jgi:methylamine---glutamate N-methyltransferase subunit B
MSTGDLTTARIETIDLAATSLRDLNARLHAAGPDADTARGWQIVNPGGRHAIAVGLDGDLDVEIAGHVGYYCAGMNKHADVVVHGNAGVGLAENMMSGSVVVEGDASQAAGATAQGGLLVVKGNASARCAISLKGADVVVHGSIGHMGAFMAQSGRLVVCGDAGDALGDSLYEARIYVRGGVAGLGADCVEKELREEHLAELRELLKRADVQDADPSQFKRYGSARTLYTFNVDDAGGYA